MSTSGFEPREVVDFIPRPKDTSGRTTDAVLSRFPLPAGTAGVAWRGDEEWVSTLPDPHDATVTETS